ncbi:phosphotransferase [Fictibacillus nanhaiensis]|uniref:phosphotransferase family protein n=1 Tax=Fictibacillus nanhaiensis TaxID=742169 RepID=UPI001C96CD31|nr:phosphotransferase [Fictibacillus nanhaiensis]MBY6037646.1 phosphotransferase [Fictibacillus nanhaiensis]
MLQERVIGYGSTAEVLEMDEGTVAKVFYDHVSAASIDHEWSVSKNVMSCGLPVPAVYQQERIDGRSAIFFEKIKGSALTKWLEDKPWTALQLVKIMAALHAKVHEKQVTELPLQKIVLQRKIEHAKELSREDKSSILTFLSNLPDGDSLCHGDFHPDNILLTEKGPVIIDWIDATQGNRMADLARTVIILRYGGFPDKSSFLQRRILVAVRDILTRHYIKSYKRSFPFSSELLKDWMLPVAAGRLSEKIPNQEKERLIRFIQALLSRAQTR